MFSEPPLSSLAHLSSFAVLVPVDRVLDRPHTGITETGHCIETLPLSVESLFCVQPLGK